MTDSEPTGERITVYADYVCPFCYLGKQSLEQYRERRDEPLEIEWQPFDLRRDKRHADGSIDHDVEDGKDGAYFKQARENVRRLQEEYGVEMAQELAIEVDSLPAQLVSYRVANEHPNRWEAFDRAVYDALWRDGRDIGDAAVLEELAADAGLPDGIVRDALADDQLREELDDRFAEAHQRGVTGVPTFVSDGYVARGAVPPAHIERLVEGA